MRIVVSLGGRRSVRPRRHLGDRVYPARARGGRVAACARTHRGAGDRVPQAVSHNAFHTCRRRRIIEIVEARVHHLVVHQPEAALRSESGVSEVPVDDVAPTLARAHLDLNARSCQFYSNVHDRPAGKAVGDLLALDDGPCVAAT